MHTHAEDIGVKTNDSGKRKQTTLLDDCDKSRGAFPPGTSPNRCAVGSVSNLSKNTSLGAFSPGRSPGSCADGSVLNFNKRKSLGAFPPDHGPNRCAVGSVSISSKCDYIDVPLHIKTRCIILGRDWIDKMIMYSC